MVALSRDEALLSRLFQYRFPAGRGLRGHSFGNLFLTALSNVTGDFTRAVRRERRSAGDSRAHFSRRPISMVSLEAVLRKRARGCRARPESARRADADSHACVWCRAGCKPLPEVLEAIAQPTLILLGPGSLYTSMIPNLLVSGVAEAIENPGRRVFTSRI